MMMRVPVEGPPVVVVGATGFVDELLPPHATDQIVRRTSTSRVLINMMAIGLFVEVMRVAT